MPDLDENQLKFKKLFTTGAGAGRPANFAVESIIENNKSTIEKINNDAEFRKQFFDGYELSGKKHLNFFLLFKVFPDKISLRDTKGIKSLGTSSWNSGAKLWMLGYSPEKCIGRGGFGIAWKCKDENGKDLVLKYVPGAKPGEDGEIELFKNINELNKTIKEKIEKDTKGKEQKASEKYLNMFETESGKLPIIKGKLAKGDLGGANAEKRKKELEKPKAGGKTINSLLRKSMQAIEAVKYLHDLGFSHNDIKPSNFLKIETDFNKNKKKVETQAYLKEKKAQLEEIKKIKDAEQKYKAVLEILENIDISDFKNKNKQIEQIEYSEDDKEKKAEMILEILYKIINKAKDRLQLTDLDSITPIKLAEGGGNDYIWGQTNTRGFVHNNEQHYLTSGHAPFDAVVKRDVYALGVTFLSQLIARSQDSEYRNYEKRLEIIQNDKKSDLDQLALNIKDNLYPGEKSEDRIKKYLELIRHMTCPNYAGRLTIEDAKKELTTI